MNGAIGVVVDIVYRDSSGPNNKETLLKHALVNFPTSIIPEEEKLLLNYPSTYVKIPVIEFRYKKKHFSMTTLIISVAITIHKSHGMTIGPNEMFEILVYYSHEDN